jgi:methanethiol S-methyltransferase
VAIRKLTACVIMIGGVLCGGGSALLFSYFLMVGPVTVLRLPFSPVQLLGWDALLALSFFGVHSLLIRRRVRSRIARLVPQPYYLAVFAIVSGVVLFLVMFLWQPSVDAWLQFDGGLAWLPRCVSLLAVVGFIWAVKSLRASSAFDPVGLLTILAYLHHQPVRSTDLVVQGPFRYVRHPLYVLMIVILWATPNLTADRVLLNVLGTSWIIIGTRLEERDLVAEFGLAYRRYQRAVPRLIPGRLLTRIRHLRTREDYS